MKLKRRQPADADVSAGGPVGLEETAKIYDPAAGNGVITGHDSSVPSTSLPDDPLDALLDVASSEAGGSALLDVASSEVRAAWYGAGSGEPMRVQIEFCS